MGTPAQTGTAIQGSLEALANHPISYDDQIVRQILESVIVESKEKIKVVFVGGLEVTQTI